MQKSILLAAAFLVAVGSGRPASACMGASHYRVFPLGTLHAELVAAVFDLHRGSNEHFRDVRWEGTARLVVLDIRGEVQRDLLSAPVRDEELRPAQQRAFLRLSQILTRFLPGFRPLSPPEVRACGFERDCGPLGLRVEEDDELHVVAKGSAAGQQLPAPDAAIAGLVSPYADEEAPAEERRALARQLWREGGRSFRLAALRTYTLDDHRRLFVLDLTQGDLRTGAETPLGLPPDGCTDLADCVHAAPTPHHGKSFDLLFVE